MVNCAALVVDHFRIKLPELGDRNLRLSTLSKCLLVFMKLRVSWQANWPNFSSGAGHAGLICNTWNEGIRNIVLRQNTPYSSGSKDWR